MESLRTLDPRYSPSAFSMVSYNLQEVRTTDFYDAFEKGKCLEELVWEILSLNNYEIPDFGFLCELNRSHYLTNV